MRHFDKYRAKGAAATEGLRNQVLHDFFFAIGAPPFYARQDTIPPDIQRLVSSLSGFCQYVQRRDNPDVINMAHRIEGALGDTVDKYFEDSQIALKQVAGPLWDYEVPNNQVQMVVPHESLPPPVRPEPHVGPQSPVWHGQPPTARPLTPAQPLTQAQPPTPNYQVTEAPRWYSHQPTRTVRPPPDHHVTEAQPYAQRPTIRPLSTDHDGTEARQWYRPSQSVRPSSPDHHVMAAQPPGWHSQPTTVHARPPSPDYQAMEDQPPAWHTQPPSVHVQPPSPDQPAAEAQPRAARSTTRTTSRRQY